MATITTRAGKGSPLTNTEMDTNLNNINAQLPSSGVAAVNGANADITSLTALSTIPTVTQTALNLKANLASPTFTGTPTLPTGTIGVTQTAGNNSTALATTAYADAASFPTGTRLTFNQTSAPTGWTKDVTAALNDSIIRIVTGTVGSGGSTAFSTFNAQTATAAYTLAIADIPAHTHTTTLNPAGAGIGTGFTYGTNGAGTSSPAQTSSSIGGGGAHSHGMTTAIKYNDFIIASKN